MLWQPIETAPKDGTVIDLWMAGPNNSGARRPNCWWGGNTWWCDNDLIQGYDGPEFYVNDVPTYWMPIIAPPNTTQTSTNAADNNIG